MYKGTSNKYEIVERGSLYSLDYRIFFSGFLFRNWTINICNIFIQRVQTVLFHHGMIFPYMHLYVYLYLKHYTYAYYIGRVTLFVSSDFWFFASAS